MNIRLRRQLFLRITIYFVLVGILIVEIAIFFPEFLRDLPFGGLDYWKNQPAEVGALVNFEDLEMSQHTFSLFEDSINLITAMLGIIIVMVPVRWVYKGIGDNKNFNPAVASSLFLIPMVVTAIVAIVQFSLALAFALAGIVAGVRYRTTLKNLADAFFTFSAIAVGLAAGTRSLGIGLVLAIFFCYAILIYPPVEKEVPDEATDSDTAADEEQNPS